MYGYDAMSSNVRSIPGSAGVICGYVTGSPYINWSQGDYNLFPNAHHEFIDQGNGIPWKPPTVIDVENGAHRVGDVPRLAAAYPGVKVYCNRSTLEAVLQVFHGPLWIAAPGLSDAQALEYASQLTAQGHNVWGIQNQWGTVYDRTLLINHPAPKPPPVHITPVPPKPVVKPTPPPVEHINVDGWNLRKPDADIIPVVISWWGNEGVTRRQSNLPRKVWSQIPWSK